MQLVQSGDMTAWQATQVLWRRGGVAAFFRQGWAGWDFGRRA